MDTQKQYKDDEDDNKDAGEGASSDDKDDDKKDESGASDRDRD